MLATRIKVARALLVVCAAVPISYAIGLAGPLSFQRWWMGTVLGGTLPTDAPVLDYLASVLALYLLAYGIFVAWLSFRPQRHPFLVRAVGVFLVARGVQRAWLADEMLAAFRIDPSQHILPVALTVLLGAALVIAAPTSRSPRG